MYVIARSVYSIIVTDSIRPPFVPEFRLMTMIFNEINFFTVSDFQKESLKSRNVTKLHNYKKQFIYTHIYIYIYIKNNPI